MAKIYTCIFLFFFLILGIKTSKAQTVVTPAPAVTNLCVGGGFTTLGTINIAETVNTDFNTGTGKTYTISAPANIQFNTGATPSVTSTGGGVTNIVASAPTTTTFTFTCDIAGGSLDQINISGLQIKAVTTPSTGALARSGGTANFGVGGQTHCDVTSLGNVSITGQPSNQTVCIGASPTFTTTATGAGLSYAWQISTNGGGSWATPGAGHSGITSATLTVSGVAIGQDGDQYKCIVSGTCGGPVTSNVVTLTVNPDIAITGQPSDATACTGTTFSFTVTATGPGLSYNWEKSTDGGATWIAPGGTYSGVNSATLSNTAVLAQDGFMYQCVVSGTCGGPTTSNPATLSVPGSAASTTNPNNQTICSGGTATFSVTGTNAVSYQWQENGVNISNGGVYSGATTNTLTLTGVTTAMGLNGKNYRAVVSGSCGTPATSTSKTLTVNPVAIATTQPSNQGVCVGANTSFTVAGTNITNYQWQVSVTGGGGPFVNLTNSAPYSNVTTATMNITSATVAMNGYVYRCNLSSASCGITASNNATLTVNSPSPATYFGLDAAYCRNGGIDTLEGFPVGGTFSGPGVGATNAGTGKAPFNPLAAGVGNKNITYNIGCTNVVKSTTVNDSSNIAFT
ncbi:MAG: hypothetical protein ACJ75J_05205, partial [Cytophagaceae bacterium]